MSTDPTPAATLRQLADARRDYADTNHVLTRALVLHEVAVFEAVADALDGTRMWDELVGTYAPSRRWHEFGDHNPNHRLSADPSDTCHPAHAPGHAEPETTTWLTVTDIAGLLGVSRPRVWQLRKHPGFPQPAGRHGRTDYWTEPAIQAWATAVGRSLDKDAQPAGDDDAHEQLNQPNTQTRRRQ